MAHIEFMPHLSQVNMEACENSADNIPEDYNWFSIMDDSGARKY